MLRRIPQTKLKSIALPQFLQHSRKALTFLTIAASVIVLGLTIASFVRHGENQGVFVYYTVAKADLPLVVTERGNLESQVETNITCQVENVGTDRSGNYGTQIIQIVPNGAAVQEGQLLVEFDSATIRDRLDQQVLAYQKAVSAKTQAIAKYNNQLIQNKTAFDEAELAVALAGLELQMYVDESSGTLQLAKEEIERLIDEAKNASLEARAALRLAEVEKTGMEELFTLGYRGKADLDQTHLKFMGAEDKFSAAVNRVKTHQANLRKLDKYESEMEKLRLSGAVATAERGLLQVQNDNESLAEQALAAKNEAESTELKEKERLERLNQQLANCQIFAPHSGMAVYARDRRGGSEVAEGATVRERQDILTLPDLSRMRVRTQVHEAMLDQVRVGLRATVRVDAFPGSVYPAVVDKVAVVPSSDGWYSGSVKTYETVVRIEQDVENLKPGMTAVVDIHVDRIQDVFTVPVQAVVQVDRDNWCYVDSGRGVERRDIQIGRSNSRFVHVKEGLGAGDRVVLNPMDVMDEKERVGKDISPETGLPAVPEAVEAVAQGAAETSAAETSAAEPEVPVTARAERTGRPNRPPGGGRQRVAEAGSE